MKKSIKILAAVMAVIMLTAFTDVSSSHWAYKYITRAKELGIVNGVTKETFVPENTLCKQELAVMIYRAVNANAAETLDTVETDAAISLKLNLPAWAEREITYGIRNDFWTIAELSEGNGVSDIISRQLVAKWICKGLNLSLPDFAILPYNDSDEISSEFERYVYTLYQYSIMRGDNLGCFKPSGILNRAEGATAVTRAYDAANGITDEIKKAESITKSGTLSFISNTTFKVGNTKVSLTEDANVYIDGETFDAKSLKALSGKNVTVSCCDDHTLFIQSKPAYLIGVVEEVTDASVTFRIGEESVKTLVNVDSDFISKPEVGKTMTFMLDGAYIIEVKE